MYTVHVLGIDGVGPEYRVFASRAAAERSVIRFEKAAGLPRRPFVWAGAQQPDARISHNYAMFTIEVTNVPFLPSVEMLEKQPHNAPSRLRK